MPSAVESEQKRNAWLILAACIVWVLLLGIVGTRQALYPEKNTVFPVYMTVGQQWINGQNVYTDNAFRYSPAAAGMFAVIGILPDGIDTVLWLLINTSVFFWGVWWWARVALPRFGLRVPPRYTPVAQVAALFLVLTPLAIANFNNLQANPLVLGLLLAAVAACVQKRWNVVVICITVATLLKIYPLALGLVLVVLYPRQLGWRLAVALVLGALLPFAMQYPSYVLESYRNWVTSLAAENRIWRDQRDLIKIWETWSGLRLSPFMVGAVRAFGVLAVGLGSWFLRTRPTRDFDRPRLLVALGMVVGWIMLLGPNTESATYILLAPLATWALLASWSETPGSAGAILFAVAYGLLIIAGAAIWFPGGKVVQEWGLQPLAALLWVIAMLRWAVLLPAVWPQSVNVPLGEIAGAIGANDSVGGDAVAGGINCGWKKKQGGMTILP